jgi:hypothetical protein
MILGSAELCSGHISAPLDYLHSLPPGKGQSTVTMAVSMLQSAPTICYKFVEGCQGQKVGSYHA